MDEQQMAAAMASMVRNLEQQTGNSLADWIAIVRQCELAGFKPRVDWLKQNHGLGHGYAQLVVREADKAAAPAEAGEPDLLAGQFSGAKAALRPIYDRLEQIISALGPEVSVGVRKTMVGFSMGRQFACTHPMTAKRLDLSLALPDVEPTGRLKEAKATAMGRINRVVGLTAVEEIDEEVLGWIRAAYEGAPRG